MQARANALGRGARTDPPSMQELADAIMTSNFNDDSKLLSTPTRAPGSVARRTYNAKTSTPLSLDDHARAIITTTDLDDELSKLGSGLARRWLLRELAEEISETLPLNKVRLGL
jgi:hypothetical protein